MAVRFNDNVYLFELKVVEPSVQGAAKLQFARQKRTGLAAERARRAGRWRN